MPFTYRLIFCSHIGCGKLAVPWGLYVAPLRPGSERSWGVCWGLVSAGGLAEVWLSVSLIWPQCGIMLVLLNTAVSACVWVGIAVTYKILCGPGDAAVGQTHITLPVKVEIHSVRRCRAIWRGVCLFVFTVDIVWLAAWLWCLSDRNNAVQYEYQWLQLINNIFGNLSC